MKAVLFGVALGVVSAGAVIATLVATSYPGAAALFVVGFLGIAVAGAVFMRARLGKSALRSRTRARAVLRRLRVRHLRRWTRGRERRLP